MTIDANRTFGDEANERATYHARRCVSRSLVSAESGDVCHGCISWMVSMLVDRMVDGAIAVVMGSVDGRSDALLQRAESNTANRPCRREAGAHYILF